jgi:hypothetical protein
MPKVIQDQFDTVSGVGGKYLAPKRPLDYIVSFLTLTFLSAAIAGGGILGLRIWDTGVILSGQVVQEQPTVPQSEIAIVDGTNSGLAQGLSDSLIEEGWNVVSAISLSDLDPALEPAPATLIFVSSAEFEADARVLATNFPGAVIQVSEQFSSPVTVLIGTDYSG